MKASSSVGKITSIEKPEKLMISLLKNLWAYFSFDAPNFHEPKQPSQPAAVLPPVEIHKANPSSAQNADELQKEIRAQRKFSLAEAIGREGGSFMKGESTIPRPLRAIAQINQFIISHLANPTGALSTTLQNWASQDIRVSRQLDTPLIALAQIIESILAEPTTFYEFARQVAIAQSTLTGDRPYFQQPNSPPHPEADYAHHTIRTELATLLQALQADLQPQP